MVFHFEKLPLQPLPFKSEGHLDPWYYPGYDNQVPTAKVAITLDEGLLKKVDRLVKKRRFANRSQAIQVAVEEKLLRLEKKRLAEECAKLDPAIEQALADEGLLEDIKSWPDY